LFSLFAEQLYDRGSSGFFSATGLTSISSGSRVAVLKFLMPRPSAPPISGSLPAPKDNQDDHQDDQHFWHAYSKHGSFSFSRVLLTVTAT